MNQAVEEYRQRIFEKIDLKIKPGSKVLDLGCGDGYDSLWFAEKGARVTGVDMIKSHHWSKIMKNYPQISFIKANAENLSFTNGRFDIVFAKDAIHHSQNPQKFLEEAWRLTKESGCMVIVEANRSNPLFYVHLTLLGGHQHFGKRKFRDLVKELEGGKKIKFLEFEAHVFPCSERIRKLAVKVENRLEKLSFWRPFLSYNVAAVLKISNEPT